MMILPHKIGLCMLAFTMLAGCAQERTALRADIPKPKQLAWREISGPADSELPRWLPWAECNQAPPHPNYVNVLEGCRAWAGISTVICVSSTIESCQAVYCALRVDAPEIAVLPGIKTSSALAAPDGTRIDNVTGWAKVARSVALSSRICGSRFCVIENESGWNPYLRGEYEPDWVAVRTGLGQLARLDVQLLWYPAAVFADEVQYVRAQDFIRLLVETVPNVRLVTLGWATPAAVRNALSRDRQIWNESLGVPCVDICYFYPAAVRPGDWRCWQLPYVIENCPTETFLVYPGLTTWAASAQECAEALSGSCDIEGMVRFRAPPKP